MRTLSLFVIALAATPPAFAQAINIDVHDVYGTPLSTFGAAAAQPGVWNPVPPTLGTTPLVDIGGNATSATITATGMAVGYSNNNPGTTGDDQALMDDLSDPSPNGATWTISGLQPGNYVLITYAWAPDNPLFISNVTVAGSSDPAQTVGGSWPGGYQLGVTHALHHVSVGAGGSIAMSIRAAGGGSFGSLNGFQVVLDSNGLVPNCFPGSGGIIPCPCGNPPAGGGLGCNNFGAGPAQSGTLAGSGTASLANDTITLLATGENNTSTTVFWTGKNPKSTTGVVHGAGVRCVTQGLKRLYTGTASGGAITRPGAGDPSVSARTAQLYGTSIVAGETRKYFNIYRDPQAAGPCGSSSSTINLTNSGSITWSP